MTQSAADALLRQQVDDHTFAFLSALLASPELSVEAAEHASSLAPGAGRRLLKRADVRHVLGELLRRRTERHEDVRTGVIHMLWRMACADPRGAWRDGQQLAPWELPDELAAVLESVKPVTDQTGLVVGYAYRFAKRAQILDLLLKHFDGPKLGPAKSSGEQAVQIVFRGVENAEDAG